MTIQIDGNHECVDKYIEKSVCVCVHVRTCMRFNDTDIMYNNMTASGSYSFGVSQQSEFPARKEEIIITIISYTILTRRKEYNVYGGATDLHLLFGCQISR